MLMSSMFHLAVSVPASTAYSPAQGSPQGLYFWCHCQKNHMQLYDGSKPDCENHVLLSFCLEKYMSLNPIFFPGSLLATV